MALRPARTFRDPDKVPYTRKSRKNMSKNYVKTDPHQHLHQFRMGKIGDYEVTINLIAQDTFYHRDNALEASRQAVVRTLEKKAAGKYYFVVLKYPHHIIRENKMVAGAGADRISKGMRLAFGKPTHKAALIKAGDKIFTVQTFKEYVDVVKEAFRKASRKLSGNWKVVIEEKNVAN
jgi:large subunit ribosomal protein L10e